MNKKDFNNDFGQPRLKTQKDYETFTVENSPKPARDETIDETVDRYIFLYEGGDKPKHYDDPYIRKIDKMDQLEMLIKRKI